MRIIISILLVICFIPVVQADDNSLHIAVRLVFVEPTGETFTADEMQYTTEQVQQAFAFWNTLSPISTTMQLVDTQFVTTTDDVYDAYEPLAFDPRIRHDNAALIFAIDNSNSRRILISTSVGYTTTSGMWVLGTENGSTYAHELGHYVYALPHQYTAQLDIMALDPYPAYQRHMLGCATLEVFGKECYTVLLPIVQ